MFYRVEKYARSNKELLKEWLRYPKRFIRSIRWTVREMWADRPKREHFRYVSCEENVATLQERIISTPSYCIQELKENGT